MDKQKYIKWYKIAREEINDDYLIPEKTDKEILNLVSREDWLMFVLADLDNTKQAKNIPRPNIFMYIREDNKDCCGIGVTFNQVGAVDVLKNILSRYCTDEKAELTKLLLGLDGSWKITVSRKIKDHNWQQTPKYINEIDINCNRINNKIVDQIVECANRIRQDGKEKRKLSASYYMETPSVNLVETEFVLGEDTFKKKVHEACNILKVCLNIKSDVSIRKIRGEKEKLLKEFTDEYYRLQKILTCKDMFIAFGRMTIEQSEQKEKELSEIKKKIQDLGDELK